MNNNSIKYKNTNNDFVPQIPENWELRKIKFASSLQSGFAFKSSEYSEEGYPVFRIGDILDEININNCPKYPIAKSKSLVDFRVYNGDILIALTGATIGKTALIKNLENFGLLNQRVAKLEKPTKFLYYSFLSKPIQEQIKLISNGSAQENISNKTIENFYIPFPSADQQVAIANFLDKKCEQINQFIADKKQLINLLKEQRQSIVSNYVNSGCVENLSLKENPTIWLKESRSDWQFIKLKHLVELNKSSIDNAKKKNDLQKIALENIDNWTGKFLDGKKDAFEGQGVEFNKGDVLFNKLRPYLAKAIIAQNDGYCVGELLVLKPLQELITSEFLFFRLMTVEIIDYVNGSTYGAKMPRANWDFIGNIKIPLPSIDEQNIIVSKIKEETKTIDETIFKTEEELRLVAEYKEALISNAVTGQLHIA